MITFLYIFCYMCEWFTNHCHIPLAAHTLLECGCVAVTARSVGIDGLPIFTFSCHLIEHSISYC